MSKVNSMTGFGFGTYNFEIAEEKFANVHLEIKTVNSRYLDIQIRLPNEYSELEPKIRKIIGDKISRGRISIFSKRDVRIASKGANLNQEEITKYLNKCTKIAKDTNSYSEDFQSKLLLRLMSSSTFISSESSVEEISDKEKKIFLDEFTKTFKQVEQSREQEGLAAINSVKEYAQELRVFSKKLESFKINPEQYRKRIEELIEPIIKDIKVDESRLASEIAVIAEKRDICEELNRLESHLTSLDKAIEGGGVLGRKLEFTCQELNREFNTIGSKANDAEVQQIALSAKLSIDKIREQSANIE